MCTVIYQFFSSEKKHYSCKCLQMPEVLINKFWDLKKVYIFQFSLLMKHEMNCCPGKSSTKTEKLEKDD